MRELTQEVDHIIVQWMAAQRHFPQITAAKLTFVPTQGKSLTSVQRPVVVRASKPLVTCRNTFGPTLVKKLQHKFIFTYISYFTLISIWKYFKTVEPNSLRGPVYCSIDPCRSHSSKAWPRQPQRSEDPIVWLGTQSYQVLEASGQRIKKKYFLGKQVILLNIKVLNELLDIRTTE